MLHREEDRCTWTLEVEKSRSGSCDRGNFFGGCGNDVMLLPTPLPVRLKWSEWPDSSLSKEHQEHLANMSQSTNTTRGDLSPNAPQDAQYPPQLHAGAVGLGPEFGKGAVRTRRLSTEKY